MNDEELAKYAAATEGSQEEPTKNMASLPQESIGRPDAKNKLQEAAAARLQELNEKSNQQLHEERVSELQQRNRTGGRGFLPIAITDLPSKGIFYPEGTKLFVKSATLGDIKSWSSTDENDLTSIDNALNNILESCCILAYPENYGVNASWRDLKEIDRFYIILAIHDFTWPDDKNPLKISIDEKTEINVKKDNIEFVKFSDKLMKFYNEQKRCFSFPAKAPCFEGGMMNIYIPNVGIAKWLNDYISTRQQRQEGFDTDFAVVASLLIPDYRGLNNDTYIELVESTSEWTAYEWSLITKVRSVIEASMTPKLKYIDDGGVEKDTALNFRGGIKAIFQQNLDIDL